MKKQLTIIVSVLLFSGVYGQTSLWEVAGNGTKLYIGGTVHVLQKSDYPLPEEFDKVYQLADALVFEADISQMNSPQAMQNIMRKGMYADGRTLQSVLSEEIYKKLNDECAKIGLPLQQMNQFKPSIVVFTLLAMQLSQFEDVTDGVDKHYLSKAQTDGKTLLFLETIEEQMAMLANLGEGEENEFVSYSLDDMEHFKEEFDNIKSSWRNGSSGEMGERIKEMKQFPEIYQSMVVDRNNSWLDKIETYLQNDRIEYMLVGNLHLHGEDGLLKKLEEKGYTVKQVQ